MPKVKLPKASQARRFSSEFKGFQEENGQLFCTYCSTYVNSDRRSLVLQHINTTKHQRLSNRSSSQPLIKETVNKQQVFCNDIASMLVEADIPVSKLDHPAVRQFFAKYVQHNLPSESTIRKNYIPKLYDEKVQEMRQALVDKYIWIAVDETTDVCGRCVTNVFAGTLKLHLGNFTR